MRIIWNSTDNTEAKEAIREKMREMSELKYPHRSIMKAMKKLEKYTKEWKVVEDIVMSEGGAKSHDLVKLINKI